MADENTTVQTETGPATQPQTSQAETSAPEAQAENVQQDTPQYVTPEQLEQVARGIEQRLKQSNRDRTNAINAQIADIKALLEKTGVQIAPEHEAKLREEIGERYDDPGAAQPTESAQLPDADALVMQFVTDVFAETGTQVTPTDPEWKELDAVIAATWNDPRGGVKVTAAAVKASEKKAARLSNQGAPDARVVGSGGSTPGGTPYSSAQEAWSQAYRK